MKFLNTYKLRQKPRLGAKQSTGGDTKKNIENEMDRIAVSLGGMAKSAGQAIDKLSDTNSRLSAGLGVIISQYESVNKQVLENVKAITALEQHNSGYNNLLKISSVRAQKVAANFRDVGAMIGFSDKTTEKYVKTVQGMIGATLLSGDSTSKFANAMIQGQTIMQENIGLTAEQAEGFEQYSNSLGTTSTTTMQALQGLAKSFADQTGGDALAIQAEIMGEIGSLSEETQLQYGRMPGNLETAVLKAKALGMTMENLKQTGEKLLDIESSVGDELEYQLLSGQRLVKNGKSLTNAYRMAFMEGNGEKQAEIMNDILKDQGDTLRNNYMARKKMSELLGIDEKTLTRSLNKQKIAAELGAEQLQDLKGQKLTDEIEALKKGFDGTPEEYTKYVEKLNQFKAESDTRTALEQITEDGLKDVADAVKALSGNIDVGEVSKKAKEYASGPEVQGLKQMLNSQQELLGHYKIVTEVSNTFEKTVSELSTSVLKGFSGIDKAVQNGLTTFKTVFKAVKMLEYEATPNLPATPTIIPKNTGANLISQNPTNNTSNLGTNNITSNSGTNPGTNPVISTIAPADMIAFAKVVAGEVKTSLAGVTIKTDTMFGSTSLNGPYRIGNS